METSGPGSAVPLSIHQQNSLQFKELSGRISPLTRQINCSRPLSCRNINNKEDRNNTVFLFFTFTCSVFWQVFQRIVFVASLSLIRWKQEISGALGVKDKFAVLTKKNVSYQIILHHIAPCHVVLHHTAPNDMSYRKSYNIALQHVG